MLLPLLFYARILGLGLEAHRKPAHRALSLLSFGLALGFALALVPTTTTALPTVSGTAYRRCFADALVLTRFNYRAACPSLCWPRC